MNEDVNGEDRSQMKRLAPERRNQLIKDHLRHLVSDWTCRYGEWNRQKLLAELESALKTRRRKKEGAEPAQPPGPRTARGSGA